MQSIKSQSIKSPSSLFMRNWAEEEDPKREEEKIGIYSGHGGKGLFSLSLFRDIQCASGEESSGAGFANFDFFCFGKKFSVA